jgi:predicted nucleic-acid-binding protein
LAVVAALDTNILVRYLVQDDEAQFAAAKNLIQSALRTNERLYIPTTVILELEWVLRSNYRLEKDQVTVLLTNLLAAVELSFESEFVLEVALTLFKKTSADFADCVHIASAFCAGEKPFWTFDQKASKIEGARLLAF